MPRFRSKIDAWLAIVLLVSVVVSSGTAIGLLRSGDLAPLAILPLLATGLVLWILGDTWYGVTDTHLLVRCGPLRTSVPISSIRSVRPTRTAFSSPALSLDRMQVTHDGGTLVISPADKPGFLQVLRARQPGLDVVPAAAQPTKAERTLLWVTPIVPVVVLSVVAYAMFRESKPLQVDVTSQAITVQGSWGTTLPLADITAVSLVDTLPTLRRTRGYGTWTTTRGRVTSSDLGGAGHAYVTHDAPPFIVVRTAEGFLVINMNDAASTRRLFDQLQATVGPPR